MPRELLHRFAALAGIDLVYEAEDGVLTPYADSPQDSPLCQDAALRDALRAGLLADGRCFLLQDAFRAYFFALPYQNGRLYCGPMCNSYLNAAQRKQFYQAHHADSTESPVLRHFTLRQIKDIAVLAASLFCNVDLPEEALFAARPAGIAGEPDIQRDLQKMVQDNEAFAEAGLYRHTYHEEQQLLGAVLAGDAGEAVRIAENMDGDSGRFSQDEEQHWRILAVIGISQVARAAISAGIFPDDAYRISGYYIRKCAAAQARQEILYYRNLALEDFCGQVQALRRKKTGSLYTAKCMDYLRKHYRERIYLEDIAAPMGITGNYLSRLFHKETGQTIQACINLIRVERAAELLVYSEMPLPAIAAYVHFPTQSYFGQVFKQIMGTTPSEYRKAHRVSEFWMDAPEGTAQNPDSHHLS